MKVPESITEGQRNWGSVRAILEAGILAALLWTGDNLTTMKVQMATLQAQLTSFNSALVDLAELKARMSASEREAARQSQALLNNTEAIRELRQNQQRLNK